MKIKHVVGRRVLEEVMKSFSLQFRNIQNLSDVSIFFINNMEITSGRFVFSSSRFQLVCIEILEYLNKLLPIGRDYVQVRILQKNEP